MDEAELRRRFEYHPPSTDRVRETHEEVRARCLDLAMFLNDLLPEGREKSMALTSVDEACVWANASTARTQLRAVPPPARSDRIGGPLNPPGYVPLRSAAEQRQDDADEVPTP